MVNHIYVDVSNITYSLIFGLVYKKRKENNWKESEVSDLEVIKSITQEEVSKAFWKKIKRFKFSIQRKDEWIHLAFDPKSKNWRKDYLKTVKRFDLIPKSPEIPSVTKEENNVIEIKKGDDVNVEVTNDVNVETTNEVQFPRFDEIFITEEENNLKIKESNKKYGNEIRDNSTSPRFDEVFIIEKDKDSIVKSIIKENKELSEDNIDVNIDNTDETSIIKEDKNNIIKENIELSEDNVEDNIDNTDEVFIDELHYLNENFIEEEKVVNKDNIYEEKIVKGSSFSYKKSSKEKSAISRCVKKWITNIYKESQDTKYKSFLFEGLEADDIISIMCKKNKGRRKTKSFICSSDKDFFQLLKFGNVVIFNPIHKKMIELTRKIRMRKLLTKIIIGDLSDSIPSIVPKDLIVFHKDKEYNLGSIQLGGKTVNDKLEENKNNVEDLLYFRREKMFNKQPKKNIVFTLEKIYKVLKSNFLINKKLIDFEEIPLELRNGFLGDFFPDVKVKTNNKVKINDPSLEI